jgi:hypothetical protein
MDNLRELSSRLWTSYGVRSKAMSLGLIMLVELRTVSPDEDYSVTDPGDRTTRVVCYELSMHNPFRDACLRQGIL